MNLILKHKLEDSEIENLIYLVCKADEFFAQNPSLEKVQENLDKFLHHHLNLVPQKILDIFNEFKTGTGPFPIIMISGLPVNNKTLGQTPSHWNSNFKSKQEHQIELIQFIFSSLIGEVFGFKTCQRGSLIQNIIPIKGHENEQFGSSSKAELYLHTEDAFTEKRARFLNLACLRNPQRAETILSIPDLENLGSETIEVLLRPNFTILPDDSHLLKPTKEETSIGNENHNDDLIQSSEKVSLLFHENDQLQFRYDDYYTPREVLDFKSLAAYKELKNEIDSKCIGITLEPGDFLFLDNFKIAHGRSPFTANYDGQDRWLKRSFIRRKSLEIENGK